MCSIEDSEPWDFCTVISRRAFKEHRCVECRRKIFVGETYTLAKGLYDGRWASYKTCKQCVGAGGWLAEVCRGWTYGGILEELEEHFRDGFGTIPMGRMIVNMRLQWHNGKDSVPDGLALGRAALAQVL